MSRRHEVLCLLCALLAACSAPPLERPNILWLSIEDIGPRLGSYGYDGAVTPNLDALAARGVRFENAYAPAPVCAVTRSAIITGIYSVAQGSQFMRTDIRLPAFVRPFPAFLREAGYFTSNRRKTDYQFDAPADTWDVASDESRDWAERADPQQPFFSVINFTGTHESRNRGEFDADLFDPDALELPAFYPDTPKVRKFWASYYQNVHAADQWIGVQLQRLEDADIADNTIVIVWADHGVGLPRGKRWVYNHGLRIPLIVYVPEKWQDRLLPGMAGSASSELVSLIDLPPTMLSVAGVEVPEYMQGRVFMGAEAGAEPDVLFAHRDRMDERIDIVRTVIGKRFKYIRNFEYFKPRQQFNEYPEINEWNGIMAEIRRLNATPGTSAEADWFFVYKPLEELYDLESDPDEMLNLANDPGKADILEDMRSALRQQQRKIGDLGAIPEGMLRRWREEFGSEYAIAREAWQEVDEAWEVLRNLHRYSLNEFAELAASDNAAVRYWSAIGLGNLAATLESPAHAAEIAAPLLGDDDVSVRIAAARALLLIDESDAALETLAAVLTNEAADPVDHLAAMLVLDLVGRHALPLQQVIEAAEFRKKYPVRVRAEMLPRISAAPVRIPPHQPAEGTAP